jgi:hypothetical protein
LATFACLVFCAGQARSVEGLVAGSKIHHVVIHWSGLSLFTNRDARLAEELARLKAL